MASPEHTGGIDIQCDNYITLKPNALRLSLHTATFN
jgi:hypothetical protein